MLTTLKPKYQKKGTTKNYNTYHCSKCDVKISHQDNGQKAEILCPFCKSKMQRGASN